jgi:hypothetical protein
VKYNLNDVRKYPLAYLDFLDFFILKKILQKKRVIFIKLYEDASEYFDIGVEAFRKRVEKLRELGFFKKSDNGNPKVYSVNPDLLPIVKEILWKIEDFVLKT